MKKYILLLLVILLNANSLFAQYDFMDDPQSFTDGRVNTFKIDSKLNEQYEIEKDFDFEFRLYGRYAFGSGFVFILSWKEDNWLGRFFKYGIGDSGIEEILTPTDYMDRFWNCLVEEKVLELPDESLLKPKMIRYKADTTDMAPYYIPSGNNHVLYIADGTTYTFQLRTENKARMYSYHCPKIKLDYYPQTEEFYNAFRIITRVLKYAGQPLDCH